MSGHYIAWVTMTTFSHKQSLQVAYILHSRPYRDNSLIVEIFSREHGRVAAVAKGAKQPKSKFQGLLQPFGLLLLSWVGQNDLMTLVDAESQQSILKLSGKKLVSGFYINELLIRLLQKHDPHQQLFDMYHETLQALAEGKPEEPTLRRFECQLLQETGYGLILDHDVDTGEIIKADAQYCYHIEYGPVKVSTRTQDGLVIYGSTLIALQEQNITGVEQLKQAKQLMRAIIAHQLDGKPLRSRELAMQKVL